MTRAEAAEFIELPYAPDAIALRRWDEASKDPLATPPPFQDYRPLLRGLLGVAV